MLEDIARDLGNVGSIVEIRGVRPKEYGGFYEGKAGDKFGWRVIKDDEQDPRKTQLLQYVRIRLDSDNEIRY